jgi:hypothetical protein
VVIRDFQDVAALWKNTTALTYDPFVEAVMKSFGIAPASVEKAFAKPETLIHGEVRSRSLLINENPSEKPYIHIPSDWFKVQLLSRDRLQRLQDIYQGYLEKFLKRDDLSCSCILLTAARQTRKQSRCGISADIPFHVAA